MLLNATSSWQNPLRSSDRQRWWSSLLLSIHAAVFLSASSILTTAAPLESTLLLMVRFWSRRRCSGRNWTASQPKRLSRQPGSTSSELAANVRARQRIGLCVTARRRSAPSVRSARSVQTAQPAAL
jgi:hypothetical protein